MGIHMPENKAQDNTASQLNDYLSEGYSLIKKKKKIMNNILLAYG